MTYNFCDIILIKFPFTDNITFKKRPPLILKDTEDEDIILCRIASKSYSTSYDLEIKDWAQAGLKLPSFIRVHKLASLEKDMIDIKLGELNTLDKAIVTETINKLFR